MEIRNLEKALDIFAKLMMGESVGATGANAKLYEEYSHNAEVYDIFCEMLKRFDIKLYEYNDTLFISGGPSNKVFGYTNEELRKMMGLRTNKELFLCYFIIYNIVAAFYKENTVAAADYLRIEDVIRQVDNSFASLIDKEEGIVMEQAAENTFKALALMWDELVAATADEKMSRAAKNSKLGYVKIVMNFLEEQTLITVSGDRYYATDRLKAMAANYYEDNRSAIYELFA